MKDFSTTSMKAYMYRLKHVPLFHSMTPSEIETLLQCMNCRIGDFKKSAYIFRAGNPAATVGILLEGGVEIVRDDIFGNRTILQKALPGNMFGEAFACGNVAVLPVSVLAAADSTVLFLDYKKVISTCSAACVFHKKMLENMLRILAQKNLLLSGKIDALSARTIREKLMVYLMSCAERSGSQVFEIPFNRRQLAEYLCVDRSAMSAELSRMKKDGLLRADKQRFELLAVE